MDYTGKQFNDPIVRCHSCSRLVHRAFITVRAGCNNCGNKRFQNVTALKEDEFEALTAGSYDFGLGTYEIDPDFLSQFEEVGDV